MSGYMDKIKCVWVNFIYIQYIASNLTKKGAFKRVYYHKNKIGDNKAFSWFEVCCQLPTLFTFNKKSTVYIR